MLFTSKVDNFPLVIGESLVLGTPVIATKSEAANEVLSLVDGLSVESTDEVTRLINNKAVLNHLYGIDEIDILKKKSLEAFSGTTMLKRYIELYKQS
jgi:putative colanic acid biosynthesis glycosyltransferase